MLGFIFGTVCLVAQLPHQSNGSSLSSIGSGWGVRMSGVLDNRVPQGWRGVSYRNDAGWPSRCDRPRPL